MIRINMIQQLLIRNIHTRAVFQGRPSHSMRKTHKQMRSEYNYVGLKGRDNTLNT